jgi:poly-gamma-glutamate system protein
MGCVLKRLLQMIKTYPGDGREFSSQARFSFGNKFRLVLLAIGMAGLWYLATPSVLSEEEDLLWERVRAAQHHLSQWRQTNGIATPPVSDPFNCGLIGVEWSGLTTTLGELASKRTACNPAWAVQFTRWFDELGLEAGDRIVIYSSASFPGMLLNVIAAMEAMQLEPLLIVSLGASTWGANHPEAPWPVLASELRRNGFITKRSDYYTLGGGAELGQGLSPEGEALLRKAAKDSGVELMTAVDLEGMIKRKSELLEAFEPRVFISIGGSQANLGESADVLRLHTGFVSASEVSLSGNGVIGFAMQNHIPVIHMLNIKSISERVGIPYDSKPSKMGLGQAGIVWSLLGLALFIIILFTHRRWRLEPPQA